MKKIFFAAFAALAVTLQVSAQDPTTLATTEELRNMVTLSPSRLLSKGIRLKYERTLTPASSMGTFVTYDTRNTIYTGFQLQPFWRLYFKKHAPEGLYFQPRVVLGYHSQEAIFNEDTGEEEKNGFFNYGAGVALGYQCLFGRRNQWVIDSNLGVKLVSDEPSIPNGDIEGIEGALWHSTATGAIFDLHLSIGYRF